MWKQAGCTTFKSWGKPAAERSRSHSKLSQTTRCRESWGPVRTAGQQVQVGTASNRHTHTHTFWSFAQISAVFCLQRGWEKVRRKRDRQGEHRREYKVSGEGGKKEISSLITLTLLLLLLKSFLLAKCCRHHEGSRIWLRVCGYLFNWKIKTNRNCNPAIANPQIHLDDLNYLKSHSIPLE